MSTIKTKDSSDIFYKDWGEGQPVVMSHGWPLNGDAWDEQLFFLASRGYRAIAHDRRGHGRSSQTSQGNDMDTYADDLAQLIEALDLKNAILVGHSTGGGEVTRYVGRHGTKRVAKVALIGAVPPLLVKTAANPEGLPLELFDGIRAQITRRSRAVLQGLQRAVLRRQPDGREGVARRCSICSGCSACRSASRASYECVKAFSETDFTEDLKKFDVPTLDPARRRRPDRAHRHLGHAFIEAGQEREADGLSRRTTRAHGHAPRAVQRRSAGLHQGIGVL